ncbi:MAG: hypothetical protein ACE5FT_03845 [Candidatus Nanoarchaeia archaeon]
MAEISDDALREITDEIRELHNWVAVFETEYKLPAEVVQQLRDRLEKAARTLGSETL